MPTTVALVIGAIGVFSVMVPLRARAIMAWWINYFQFETPTREWYTRKWTPNYIRAFGVIYLALAAILLFVSHNQ